MFGFFQKQEAPKVMPSGTERFYDNEQFIFVIRQLNKLKEKAQTLSDAASKSDNSGTIAKSTFLNALLEEIDKAINVYSQQTSLRTIDVSCAIGMIINSYLKHHLEALNYFRSASKPVFGKVTKVGAYAGTYAAAGLVLSNPFGLGLATLFGGSYLNRQAKDSVGFKGNITDTVSKIVELNKRLVSIVKAESEKLNMDLKSREGQELLENIRVQFGFHGEADAESRHETDYTSPEPTK